MYLYFDKSGLLKEVINDEALRVGSDGANTVFAYFEGDRIINGVYFNILRNGDTSPIRHAYTSLVSKQIPYDANRTLNYFKYFVNYNFYTYTFDSTDLAINGLLKLTIQAYDNSDIVFALGLVPLIIEASAVATTTQITTSEYEDLLKSIANSPTWSALESYIGLSRSDLQGLTLANVKAYIDSYHIASVDSTILTGVLNTKITLNNGLTFSDTVDLGSAFNTKQVQLGIDNAQDLNIATAQSTADSAHSIANTAVTNAQTAQNTADEALALANTKNKSYSFATFNDMKTALASAVSTIYNVGDNLYIEATDSPDYWVSKVNSTPSGDYGYYEIQVLETDTSSFAKQADLNITNQNVATNTTDIATKQDKTDSNLNTTSKTIVGAINELLGNMQTNIDAEKNERIYSDNNLKNSIANLNAIVHSTVAQTVEETYNSSDYEGVPATLNVNSVDYPVIDKSNVGISELWGRNKKSDNLLVLTDIASTTVNGITYSVKNGVITVNGTATSLVTIALGTLFYGANTYSFSAFNTATTATGTIRILQQNESGAWQFDKVINLNTSNSYLANYTTTEKLSYFVDIENGAVISNLVIKPMLVLGSTASTNFVQGFSGIKKTNVSNIRVIGRNLINDLNTYPKTTNGITFNRVGNLYKISGTNTGNYPVINLMAASEAQKVFKPGHAYTLSFLNFTNNSNTYIIFGLNMIVGGSAVYYSRKASKVNTSYSFTIPSDAVIGNLILQCELSTTGNAVDCSLNIMASEGTTIYSTYSPHTEKSLTIPTAIQALPNYGVGLSNTDKSLCNYIDFTNKKYIQNISNRAYTEGDTDSDTMLTDNTTTYYKLTTPIETDISGYLTDDFIFPIETGGVIILNNDNTDYNVKSTFLTEYEIKYWQNT